MLSRPLMVLKADGHPREEAFGFVKLNINNLGGLSWLHIIVFSNLQGLLFPPGFFLRLFFLC